MKKLISYMLVLSLVVVGISFTISAHGGQRGYNQQGYGQNSYQDSNFSNELNLSEEQLEKIEEKREGFFAKREELREELQEANYDLQELLNIKGSEKEIVVLESKINQLQAKMNNIKINYWKDMRSLLTEEQLEEMQDMYHNYDDSPVMHNQFNSGFMGFGFMKGFRGQRGFDRNFRGNGAWCH